MRTIRLALLLLCQEPPDAVLHLDFTRERKEVETHPKVRRIDGAFGTALEFGAPGQYVKVPFSRTLDGIKALTLGGWFFPFRSGEATFVSRGVPEISPQGTVLFRPQERWVNFMMGTDRNGFFSATVHGNGSMPFPYVTLDEVPFDAWNQLVAVKDSKGYQTFYRNGIRVACDRNSAHAPRIREFRDTAEGEPLRLSMPQGGRIGEVWIVPRAMSAAEVKREFDSKRERYAPTVPAREIRLREITRRPSDMLRPRKAWTEARKRCMTGALKILGPFPKKRVPLDPRVHSEEDCGTYLRRKVSFQVQPGDRMPAWLLVPKNLEHRAPAVICVYGTTAGAGKDTTVGLSGRKPGSPPGKNQAFAVDLARAGFVAFAGDYLRDGERVRPGRRPYDTTDFYREFPDWSIHGKDAWDTGRAIDYLETLDFVDAERIGMTGHSYGGHSTIFTTAVEPRIRAAVANGPVSDFVHHGMHWAVPKGAGASQSMPALRPYLLDRSRPIPVTFYEFTALIAPRPLLVGQAVGERRPMEEENAAYVGEVYRELGFGDRVRYVWYPGDHDYPPPMRRAAVAWFKRWLR